jgi:hypothetical protein
MKEQRGEVGVYGKAARQPYNASSLIRRPLNLKGQLMAGLEVYHLKVKTAVTA